MNAIRARATGRHGAPEIREIPDHPVGGGRRNTTVPAYYRYKGGVDTQLGSVVFDQVLGGGWQ
jgi:hypothetical protein